MKNMFSKLVITGLLSTTLAFTAAASRFDADAPFGEGNVSRVLQNQPGIDVMRAFVMLSDTEAEREQRLAVLDRVGSTSLLRSGLDVHAIWCDLVVAIPNVAQRIFALSHIPLAEATAMDGAALVRRMMDLRRANRDIEMWVNWKHVVGAEILAMPMPHADVIADAITRLFRSREEAMIVLNGGQIDEGSACAGVSEYRNLNAEEIVFMIERIANGQGRLLEDRVAPADALRMYCARVGISPRDFDAHFVDAINRVAAEHQDDRYLQVLADGVRLEDITKIKMLEWSVRHGFGDMQDIPRARAWARGKQAAIAELPDREDAVGIRPFGGTYAPLAWGYMSDRIAELELRDLDLRLNLNGLYFENGLGFIDDFESVSYADFERYITEWVNGIPAVAVAVENGYVLDAQGCVRSLLHGSLREMNSANSEIVGLRAQLMRYIDLLRERNRQEAQAAFEAGEAGPADGFNPQDAERQTLFEIINMTHRRCAFGTLAFLEEWYPKKGFRAQVEADVLLRKIGHAIYERNRDVLYGHANINPERERGQEHQFFRPEYVFLQNMAAPLLGHRFPIRDVNERTHIQWEVGINNGAPRQAGNNVEDFWGHILNGWQREDRAVWGEVAVNVQRLRTTRDLIWLLSSLQGGKSILLNLNDYLLNNPLLHLMISKAGEEIRDSVFLNMDTGEMKHLAYIYVLQKLGMVRFPMLDQCINVALASERIRAMPAPTAEDLRRELIAAKAALGVARDDPLDGLELNQENLANGLIDFVDRRVLALLAAEDAAVREALDGIERANLDRARVAAPAARRPAAPAPVFNPRPAPVIGFGRDVRQLVPVDGNGRDRRP